MSEPMNIVSDAHIKKEPQNTLQASHSYTKPLLVLDSLGVNDLMDLRQRIRSNKTFSNALHCLATVKACII
ncbi:hypothetical protein TNCV_4170741 [Trichonephila clavipes]|nr:hypothetical protein TNCV_4170741 [Trichonephila clavipes]